MGGWVGGWVTFCMRMPLAACPRTHTRTLRLTHPKPDAELRWPQALPFTYFMPLAGRMLCCTIGLPPVSTAVGRVTRTGSMERWVSGTRVGRHAGNEAYALSNILTCPPARPPACLPIYVPPFTGVEGGGHA